MKMTTSPDTSPDEDTLDASGPPRSPVRSLNILQRLVRSSGGLTLSQLSSALDVPKTSVFSLLKALTQAGYVQTDGTRYELGPEALQLGTLIAARGSAPDASQLPSIAQPFLESLAERSGETVFVLTRTEDAQSVVYVARAESAHPIRFMASIGEKRPLYSSAGGRTVLAFMPDDEQERYLKPLKTIAFTSKTVTDKTRLRAMLKEIRRTGIATTTDDTHIGVSAYGTPVYSANGAVIAALVLAAPTERALPQSERLIALLREYAATLSRAMGYVAPMR
ncbi:IclR family transcriptional regulator [Burkholderia sp. Leaf177]|uniref:IclR family transcriptional regulator n=1 Tax=Burkholderia sp. Leaf177 TaxID=1736287 RepID=UPI000AA85DB1|nr:IclR family transcriptional regulator [Burkholderia sp. Leaf177]